MRVCRFFWLGFLFLHGGMSFAIQAIDLDYACFRGQDSLIYVEVYASLQRSQLSYTEGDSAFVARFYLVLEMGLDGKVISSDTLHGFDSVADPDELTAGQFFPYVFAYYMRPGRYNIRASLVDELGKINERKSLDIKVGAFPENSLATSSIELACLVEKSDEVSRFWKNGVRVLPNPIRFYGTQLPLFYYYCELYNLKFFPDHPDSFLIERRIRSAEAGVIIREFPKLTKKKVGTTAVETNGFPIATLRTGTYIFEIRITDLYDNAVVEESAKFWIYRPEDFEAGRVATMDTHFVERLAQFTVPVMQVENAEVALEQMKYILTTEEMARVRRLTSEGKVHFIREYWQHKAREENTTPEVARWQYFSRVEEANRRYSYLRKDGWKTDRGRVYIQLGPPDLVDYHRALEAAPEHEIWYYDRIEGGVQFWFADKRGFGDLELVHSTKRGEISDANWLQKFFSPSSAEQKELLRK